MSEWISWFEHPVPDDVRGILIKYNDGIFSDRYDPKTGKRKFKENSMIIGWKFMERSKLNNTIQCDNEKNKTWNG